jgi:hypothetical protein
MREKITILLIAVFSVSGIKAIPKDSVIYSFKAGVISPYCFKYKTYDEIATKYNTTYSCPFNAGFTIGLDASRKNFSFELSLDISSFRRLSHKRVNDTLLGIRDIPFGLTQFKFLPQYRIIYSENSSLNIGCGYTLAYPSRAYDNNDPKQSYYLYLGKGICYTVNYSYKLPKRRSSFYAGIYYEKLNDEPIRGLLPSKYDYGQYLDAPIYMLSLGVKYNIGRR